MEITIKNLLDWVVKGLVFILIITILAGAGAFIYTKYFVEPTYVARVKFYASANEKAAISGETNAKQYVEFLNVNEFYEMVAKEYAEANGTQSTPSEIAGALAFSGIVKDTSSFYVTVTTNDPEKSYYIALAVAEMGPQRIAEFEEGEMLKISSHPVLPTYPSGPNVARNTFLGVMIGLVLSCAVVVLRELLDNRIKSPEEITELFKLPVFGVVPDFSTNEKKGVK